MNAYESAHDAAAWLDLSARGRLTVTGEDAGRLLHAISTNDVKGMSDGASLYAFFLTAQGRILSDAFIHRRGEIFYLDTEPETATTLLEHIDKYIIADDAEVALIKDWDAISIEGPKTTSAAEAAGLPIPNDPPHTLAWQDGFIAKPGVCSPQGLRVIAPKPDIAKLRGRLQEQGLPELTSDDVRVLRLENGIPRYGEDISQRYLVQETGQIHAVHFNKGCYLGQEIVERVRSRAQVHRHLRPVKIQGEVPPAPGTKLLNADKEAGEITSAAYSPRFGEVAALAYIRTETMETKPELTVSGIGAKAYLL